MRAIRADGGAGRRQGRRSELRPFTAALAMAVLLLWPAAARAHITLESSSPAKDSVVASPLAELRLRFSGSVEPAYTSVMLRGPDGVAIVLKSLRPVGGTSNREFVTGPLSAMVPDGSYTVEWRTAGADGHVITGSFIFHVRTPEPVDSSAVGPDVSGGGMPAEHHEVSIVNDAPASDSLSAVSIRWLNFTALLALVGALVFRLIVLPRTSSALGTSDLALAAGHRIWRFSAIGAALAVVALCARLWLQSASLHGTQYAWDGERLWTMLSVTGWGRAWLLQLAATVVLVVALVMSRGGRLAHAGWATMAVAVTVMAFVPALSGHAAGVTRFGVVAILSDALHVLSAGAWMGTLAAVVVCGIPAAFSLPPEHRASAIAKLVRTFSALALVAVTVVVLTGAVSVLFHLQRPADLLLTSYGRALMIKLGVLLVVFGTGFYNWRYVRPRLGAKAPAGPLRQSAGIELVAGIIVVAITAVLVALPTP